MLKLSKFQSHKAGSTLKLSILWLLMLKKTLFNGQLYKGDIIHTGLIGSRSFQNYAFKGWLFLETMKLWLLLLTKTLFLMTLMIKMTLGNIFIKMKKIRQGSTTVTKQLIYFSNADNSTTLMPPGSPGSPGVSREAKLSTEFEFGSLVR